MAYTTINKSTEHFKPVAYTGNGASDRAVTSGFATDLVWIKNRNTTDDHVLFDKVRGGTKYLYPNSTSAEATYSGQDVTFESTGVDVGAYQSINQTNVPIISWHWKANGAGSANTDGSINSTATSANTTAGFSIVKWTGNGSNPSTVGHGLGAVPKMIITKRISGDTASWHSYHASIGNNHEIYLNGANAKASNTTWNNTTPTSSVFTVNSASVNTSGVPYIAYCFAEKQGYSKFGSYTGNGNADGSFIYCGFKPAFYIVKRTDGINSWILKDNKRPGYNVNGTYLVPDTSIAEATGSGNLATDEYSNGFKMRGTSTAINGSGNSYIYMAFAEAPLVGSNNIPCTAR